MTFSPGLVRSLSSAGGPRFALGDPLVDSYLAFVAGRARANTLRAIAHDLKTFFSVVGKDPAEVVAADVFEFVAHQRGDRRVIRISDGESGLSARTIARRLSSIGPVRVPGCPGRHAGSNEPGPAWVVDAPTRWPPPARAAGASAAHVAEDPLARRGEGACRRASHRPGPGDGVCDGAGRVASLRGPRPAPRRRSGGGAVVVHRRRQGRPPTRDSDPQRVLRCGR
jgi:hypothetical protein